MHNMYIAGMSNIQYTIRNVPIDLDKKLRLRSKKSGQTFNETLLRALDSSIVPGKNTPSSDLDWFYGSGGLGAEELQAFAAQRIIDESAWKSK